MKNKIILCLLAVILPYCVWGKSGDKVFVNGFSADGVTADMKTTADTILKEEFLNAGYRVTDINAVSAGLSAEELKMSLGSNDENGLKNIMASGSVDYIAYGYIRARDKYIFITAKMLDKSTGEVKLGRVKTVSIRSEISKTFFKEACTLLSEYLLKGDEKKVLKFQDKMLAEEKRYEITQNRDKLTKEDQSEYEKYQRKIDEYKKKRKDDITGNYSIFRAAYNPNTVKTDNSDFNNYFKEGHQFFVEIDIPIPTKPIGADILARYTGRYFSKNRESAAPTLFDEKLESMWEKRGYTMFNSFDFGLRLRYSYYFLMTEFNIYGIGAIGVIDGAGDLSFSALGGGGVEIAFFPYLGFFVEYNIGWSSITLGDKADKTGGTEPYLYQRVREKQKINVAGGHQFLIGAAFRI